MSAELTIRRILLPVDFAPISKKAEEYALSLARHFQAAVHMLHVIEPIGETADDPELEDFYARLTRRAVKHLEKAVRRFQKAGVESQWEVTVGPRTEIICKRAQDLGTDLIVMGSHGLQAERQFLPGSTSQRVPLIASCPVLLVR
jgi:nucleotide-binding universal stress UspA family protein